jgi:hypothetical protein
VRRPACPPRLLGGPPETQRPRVKLADAFRQWGLDEHKVAATYAGVFDNLARDTTGRKEKQLVDVLKECTRVLSPPERGAASDNSVPVFLVHDVPRPVRTDN